MKERSNDLCNAIRKDRRNQIFEHVSTLTVLFFALPVGYHFHTGIIRIIILLFVCSFFYVYMYNSAIVKNQLINRIIIEIDIQGDMIIFKTSDAFLFHIVHKRSIVLEMAKGTIDFELTDDGMGQLFSKKRDYKGKTYQFMFNDQEFYILTGFFGAEVEEMIDSTFS